MGLLIYAFCGAHAGMWSTRWCTVCFVRVFRPIYFWCRVVITATQRDYCRSAFLLPVTLPEAGPLRHVTRGQP